MDQPPNLGIRRYGPHSSFRVLALSDSGLAASASAGDTTIHVRSTTGMSVGATIGIDTGSNVEIRRIKHRDKKNWTPIFLLIFYWHFSGVGS